MTTVAYDFDVIAWAQEQAALLRAGHYALLDIEHIAEEIEDVGKSEQRELENRMALLLTHLLKWQYQPQFRGNSRRRTIIDQRQSISRRLAKTPSLKSTLKDPDWWADAWQDARQAATRETAIGYDHFPEFCTWSFDQIMQADFLPDD